MEIQIMDAVQVYSGEPARLGKKDTWVTYVVDGKRSYILTLPSEDATEAKIMDAIKKAETDRAKVVGKKFTI